MQLRQQLMVGDDNIQAGNFGASIIVKLSGPSLALLTFVDRSTFAKAQLTESVKARNVSVKSNDFFSGR